MIGGHGTLLSFVESSKTHGVWTWTDDDSKDRLRTAAGIEDKEGREFALSLIDTLDRMRAEADELRKRFETTHNALTKINESLKSQ